MSTPVAVTVATTATVLGVVPLIFTTNGGQIMIQNVGAATVYISSSPSVSTTNGIELVGGSPGGEFSASYPPSQSETWYGVVASGTGTVIVETIP